MDKVISIFSLIVLVIILVLMIWILYLDYKENDKQIFRYIKKLLSKKNKKS